METRIVVFDEVVTDSKRKQELVLLGNKLKDKLASCKNIKLEYSEEAVPSGNSMNNFSMISKSEEVLLDELLSDRCKKEGDYSMLLHLLVSRVKLVLVIEHEKSIPLNYIKIV